MALPVASDRKKLHVVGLLISSLLLALVVALNTELFFFSKVFIEPEWTKPFPDPYLASGLLVLFSLLPVAFLSKSISSAFKTLIATLAIGPMPALFLYAMNVSGDVVINVVLQYAWIVITGCLPSALVALLLSSVVRYSTGKISKV